MFTSALFWFFLCLVMAGMEIESEGPHGWARQMPTWYRRGGFWAKLYGALNGGKPLTGYHLFVFFLPLAFVHIPFFVGLGWSVAAELHCLAMYFVICVLWDFLWFVFNPHFGVKRFRKEHVWWHASSWWPFGLFPVDYASGLLVAAGLALAGSRFGGEPQLFTRFLVTLAWLAGM